METPPKAEFCFAKVLTFRMFFGKLMIRRIVVAVLGG